MRGEISSAVLLAQQLLAAKEARWYEGRRYEIAFGSNPSPLPCAFTFETLHGCLDCWFIPLCFSGLTGWPCHCPKGSLLRDPVNDLVVSWFVTAIRTLSDRAALNTLGAGVRSDTMLSHTYLMGLEIIRKGLSLETD